MDVTQPHDVAASIPLANATSLEVLKNLFEGEPAQEPPVREKMSSGTDQQTILAAETVEPKPAEPVVTVVSTAKRRNGAIAPLATTSQSQPEIITDALTVPSPTAEAGVSRTDLVNVLESFVNLIKNTPNPSDDKQFALQNTISFDPLQPSPQKVTLHVDDKTVEVEELRCLLVEAQETIIRLLTDRVEDRARISRMETELKLLPDLQTQADRSMAVAMNTEDFRKELTKVKFELERVRLSRVRREVDKNPRSFWRGVRGWLFKTNQV